MRTFRQLTVALVFIFAVAFPAFAGEISTTVAPPPPPSQTQTATTNGDMETPLTGQDETGSSETTVVGSVANAAVNLISALSLP